MKATGNLDKAVEALKAAEVLHPLGTDKAVSVLRAVDGLRAAGGIKDALALLNAAGD